jgi:hypothetical protein
MAFNVSVFVYPGEHTTPKMDLDLVKCALLFADHVTVYSPSLALAGAMARSASSLRDIAKVLSQLGAASGMASLTPDEWYRRLQRLRRPALRQNAEERAMATVLRGYVEKLEQICRDHKRDVGFIELQPAIHEGLVTVDDLGTSQADDLGLSTIVERALGNEKEGPDPVFLRYLDKVVDIVADGSSKTFPLTDSAVGSLLEKCISEGVFVSNGRKSNAKVSALSCSILRNLPIENVPLETMLEIRTEVRDHALAYRANVADYARFLSTEAWETGFEDEAHAIFETQVLPEVKNIERALSASRWLPALGHAAVDEITTKRWANGTMALWGGLGIVVANLPPWMILATSTLGTFASVAASAAKHHRSKTSEAEENGMFLVYKTEKSILSKR